MANPPRTRIFVGFSTVDTNIKNTQWTDRDLIKRDLVNHFFTRRGERVMRPAYGSIIWDLLFEPMTVDNVSLIVDDATGIIQGDGRVVLNSINLVEYDHGIQLQMNLTYQPLNITESFSLDFDRRSVESATT